MAGVTSGAKNLPYAISQDYNYILYHGANAQTITSAATYDSNGQILTYNGTDAADNIFIRTGSAQHYNWAYYRGTQADRNALWGNGVAINTATDALFPDNQGVPKISGNGAGASYQSTSWSMPQNNPCPTGWCVPTQEEWETTGAYVCDSPNEANGDFNMSAAGSTPANSPFTWIPAVCGGTAGAGKCIAGNICRTASRQ